MKKLIDNSSQKRFEYPLHGYTAFVEYIINKQGLIFLTHTEVPKDLRGQGVAFDMIEEVFQEVSNRELKIVPLCPTVATFMRRFPDWKKLLANGYNV